VMPDDWRSHYNKQSALLQGYVPGNRVFLEYFYRDAENARRGLRRHSARLRFWRKHAKKDEKAASLEDVVILRQKPEASLEMPFIFSRFQVRFSFCG